MPEGIHINSKHIDTGFRIRKLLLISKSPKPYIGFAKEAIFIQCLISCVQIIAVIETLLSIIKDWQSNVMPLMQSNLLSAQQQVQWIQK